MLWQFAFAYDGLPQFLDENDRLFQAGSFLAAEGLYWTVNNGN